MSQSGTHVPAEAYVQSLDVLAKLNVHPCTSDRSNSWLPLNNKCYFKLSKLDFNDQSNVVISGKGKKPKAIGQCNIKHSCTCADIYDLNMLY